MISRSNALLSGCIAESAPSFEIFFAPEGLHKLPGFVIALVHPTAAFGHHSEKEFMTKEFEWIFVRLVPSIVKHRAWSRTGRVN
jgi:hypothetical protein